MRLPGFEVVMANREAPRPASKEQYWGRNDSPYSSWRGGGGGAGDSLL